MMLLTGNTIKIPLLLLLIDGMLMSLGKFRYIPPDISSFASPNDEPLSASGNLHSFKPVNSPSSSRFE